MRPPDPLCSAAGSLSAHARATSCTRLFLGRSLRAASSPVLLRFAAIMTPSSLHILLPAYPHSILASLSPSFCRTLSSSSFRSLARFPFVLPLVSFVPRRLFILSFSPPASPSLCFPSLTRLAGTQLQLQRLKCMLTFTLAGGGVYHGRGESRKEGDAWSGESSRRSEARRSGVHCAKRCKRRSRRRGCLRASPQPSAAPDSPLACSERRERAQAHDEHLGIVLGVSKCHERRAMPIVPDNAEAVRHAPLLVELFDRSDVAAQLDVL